MTKDEGRELIPFEGDTENILMSTFSDLIAALGGIASSDIHEHSLSASRILQGVFKGRFIEQLTNEWKGYREKGKIKEDYQTSEQHYNCLKELLEALDNDNPDQVQFDLLKKIFLVAASEEITDRKDLLPHEYMRVCRGLRSGAILVLSTAYSLAKNQSYPPGNSARTWLQTIAQKSGLVHEALAEIHEQELMDKHLITGRALSDRSGVETNPYYRLTSLAMDICKYIEAYEEKEEGGD